MKVQDLDPRHQRLNAKAEVLNRPIDVGNDPMKWNSPIHTGDMP